MSAPSLELPSLEPPSLEPVPSAPPVELPASPLLPLSDSLPPPLELPEVEPVADEVLVSPVVTSSAAVLPASASLAVVGVPVSGVPVPSDGVTEPLVLVVAAPSPAGTSSPLHPLALSASAPASTLNRRSIRFMR